MPTNKSDFPASPREPAFPASPQQATNFLPLLRSALDLPSAQRAEFICAQCPSGSLRDALLAALAAHSLEDAGELSDPEGVAARALLPGAVAAGQMLKDVLRERATGTELFSSAQGHRALQDRTGQTIGAYRLVRRLGAGGMGEVWLAERIGGFSQRVAIKWAHPTKLSSGNVARFDLERQLAASLEHPGIARVLDGGLDRGATIGSDIESSASEVALWFAMDYVDGPSLDQFIADTQPNLRARLGLMLQLCDAVHFAHQRLVVHRDLKPSNVLIDAQGRVRLIDFGIAKQLDAQTPLTQSALPMTYSYAAPEQIRGDAISTASDVYALGGILFELLCGTRVHAGTNNSALEIMKAITERDAVAPSTRIGPGGDQRIRPAQVQGDLDTITLKALARDPVRRYGSVQALSEDLQRYLSGQPITARMDSLAYRVGKLIRRNAWVSALAASLLVAIIGSAVLSARQAQINAQATERALAQARQAESVITHMTNVLNLAQSQGETVGTAQLFAWAADPQISGEYGDEAIILALKIAVSDVLIMRNDYARALTLTDAIAPQLSAASAREQLHVALNRARAQIGTGYLELAEQTLATAKKLLATPANTASALYSLYQAELLRAQGQNDAAIAAALEAAAAIETASDASALEHGVLLASVAATLLQSGKLDDAGRVANRAVAVWQQGKVVANSALATTRMISANAAYLRGHLPVVLREIDAITATGDIEAPGAIAARKVTYAKALVLTGQAARGLALAESARSGVCDTGAAPDAPPVLDCVRQTISILDTSMVAADVAATNRYLAIATQFFRQAPNPVLEANLELLRLRAAVLQSPSDATVASWLKKLASAPPTGLALRSTVRVLLVSAQQLQQNHPRQAAQLAAQAITLSERLPSETGGMDQSLLSLWRTRIAKTPASADALRDLEAALGAGHAWLLGW